MTSTAKQPARYSAATLTRAERAVRAMPFNLALFQTMRWQSVDLRAIAGPSGVQTGYVKRMLSEPAAERDLLWLIQVGMLRREVDGQGLTNSFRLTPLGHQLVDQWQERLPSAASLERLSYLVDRWLRLPSWLQPL
ncbi:MAG: Npun_F0494 family protein [Elainella sp.]